MVTYEERQSFTPKIVRIPRTVQEQAASQLTIGVVRNAVVCCYRQRSFDSSVFVAGRSSVQTENLMDSIAAFCFSEAGTTEKDLLTW